MKKQDEDRPAPDFSDVELLLPQGCIRTDQTAVVWRAIIIKASVFQAFVDYYRKCAEKMAEALEASLQPDEQLTEGMRDHYAVSMAVHAMRYIDSQIDQAVQDAFALVLQEAINRPAVFATEIFGADEATRRAATPSRGNIKATALELLRKRHASVEFRGPGRVDDWTPLQLRIAILEAMSRIETLKNRTKGRVAAIFYGEDYEQATVSRRKALTTALNDLMKDKIDYEELERSDGARRRGGG